VRAVPHLCELYPGICLTTEEKARKNLSHGKKNLSQGQKNLSQGKENLSQGQENLSQGKENLSQGKENLRVRKTSVRVRKTRSVNATRGRGFNLSVGGHDPLKVSCAHHSESGRESIKADSKECTVTS
jgi:uncharacterized phage infection (PIP) family protein YhgE